MSDDLWDSIGPVGRPTAVLDLDAFDANATAMLRAAGGKPIRVASKSVRVRGLVERALSRQGFNGVLGYSAAEAIFLARHGITDIVIAYPTVDKPAVQEIAADPALAGEITFMVDLPEHVALLASCATDGPLQLCLDVDSSLRVGPVSIGAHRSSVHTPVEAAALAALVERTAGVVLTGAMFYEAQVAGVPDSSAAVRLMKRRSLAELSTRRSEVIAALGDHAQLRFVNGGGTGSLAETSADPAITELAGGSGLFSPTLFDSYDESRRRPAAYFVSPVTRKPADDIVVTFAGGYLASGVADKSRMPTPVHPAGLHYFGQEGAGEVQTPLRGKAARSLDVGDLVWFRHTKAGEMCERFDEIWCVRGGAVVDRMPTYRGEGQNFG